MNIKNIPQELKPLSVNYTLDGSTTVSVIPIESIVFDNPELDAANLMLQNASVKMEEILNLNNKLTSDALAQKTAMDTADADHIKLVDAVNSKQGAIDAIVALITPDMAIYPQVQEILGKIVTSENPAANEAPATN